MTNKEVKIGDSFNTTAIFDSYEPSVPKHYDHFGICKESCIMYGRDEGEIVNINCTIIEKDLSVKSLVTSKDYDDNSVDYLLFVPYVDGEYKIIQPNIKLFNCCFPYGADAACFNKKNERIGTICRIEITKI